MSAIDEFKDLPEVADYGHADTIWRRENKRPYVDKDRADAALEAMARDGIARAERAEADYKVTYRKLKAAENEVDRAEAERDEAEQLVRDVQHWNAEQWHYEAAMAGQAIGQRKRIAEIEAERDGAIRQADINAQWAQRQNDRVVELKAEVERLKVCGTCDWAYWRKQMCEARDASGKEQAYIGEIHITDPCHFTPSRWTPYWRNDG